MAHDHMKMRPIGTLFTLAFLCLCSSVQLSCSDTETTIPAQPREIKPHWSRIKTGHSPPWRKHAAMTYDSTRKTVVLFGGTVDYDYTVPFGDTWEFDGTDWREIVTEVHPSPRYGMRLCYCPPWDTIILFGGQDGNSTFDDTWQFQNGRWTRVHPPESPSPRLDFGLVFDEKQQKLILCGGEYRRDFWTFDGQLWQRLTDVQLTYSGRIIDMAYNPETGRSIIYTSDNYSSRFTYEFDGTSLYCITPLHDIFPARFHFAFGFDRFKNRAIVFGGYDIYDFFDERWEYANQDWRRVLTNDGPCGSVCGIMTWANHLYGFIYWGGYTDDWELMSETWLCASATLDE